MSYNNENNGNRNRNRRRRGRGSRPGSPGSESNGGRPAFKTIDERSGFEKLMNKLSLGIFCKPKTSSRPQQAPKTNVTIVSSAGGPSSGNAPRQPRAEGGGQPRPPREPRAPREYVPAVPADVNTERLYVGNLSYDATESDLFELFQGVGSVKNAEVVVHSRTQRSKGFAFVTMGSVEEARRAVQELTNKEFMGRPLQISGAKPSNRSDRDDAGESHRDESEVEAAEEAAANAASAA